MPKAAKSKRTSKKVYQIPKPQPKMRGVVQQPPAPTSAALPTTRAGRTQPKYGVDMHKKVVALYKSGQSIERISRMEGMPSQKTVIGILDRNGVERRSQIVFDHEAIARDLEMFPKHTLEQVAAIHGCSVRLVSKIRARQQYAKLMREAQRKAKRK